MKHQITIWKTRAGWLAKFTDPQVRELFGTDTIPTAYTEHAGLDYVLPRITQQNPDCDIIVKS